MGSEDGFVTAPEDHRPLSTGLLLVGQPFNLIALRRVANPMPIGAGLSDVYGFGRGPTRPFRQDIGLELVKFLRRNLMLAMKKHQFSQL